MYNLPVASVMKPLARTALSSLFAVSLAVALLLVSILTIAFNEDFYSRYLAKHASYSRFESREEVDRTISGMLTFFKGEQEQLPEVFGEDEKSHLVDVKVLLDRVRFVCMLLIALWLCCGLYALYRRELAPVARNLVAGGVATLALTAFLVFAAVFFQKSFILFHEVFFPQGNWQFPMESALIRLFPREFFFDLFKLVLARTGFLGLVSLGAGLVMQRTTALLSPRDARSAS